MIQSLTLWSLAEMFTQLNPSIPLYVLGRGDGYAIAVIDCGQKHNLIWVTAISVTGEVWCAPNPEVRFQANRTMGRPKSTAIAASQEISRTSHNETN